MIILQQVNDKFIFQSLNFAPVLNSENLH